MTGRVICWTLLLAFSAALGHLAFGVFGSASGGEYLAISDGAAMGATNLESRQVHLRRKFFLNERPRRAWLKVVGRDQIKVYVNGRCVGQASERGFGAAVVADITRQLQDGPNVLAVSALQRSVSLPPLAAVEAGFVTGRTIRHLGSDDLWRCRERAERRAGWWFEVDFDDRHWQPARLTECVLRGRVDHPPGSATSPGAGHWITTPDFDAPVSCARREFQIDGHVEQAWLRLTLNAHYRLAINGLVVDVQEAGMGLNEALEPAERAYDLTGLLKTGRNTVALLVTKAGGRPQLLADLEVRDRRGRTLSISSDRQWMSQPGIPADWYSARLSETRSWQSCSRIDGQPVLAWKIRRETVDLALPSEVRFARIGAQIGMTAVIAVLTLLACFCAGRVLARLQPAVSDRRFAVGPPAVLVHLCLLPSTLLIAVGVFMTYDPRIQAAEVYRSVWLYLAVAVVFLQWALLALATFGRRADGSTPPTRIRFRFVPSSWRTLPASAGGPLHSTEATQAVSPTVVIALVGCLVLVGFCLRISGIADDPLHPDETTMYRATQGVFECGFPRVRIHETLPPAYVATSEAVFYGTALAEVFFDDPRYVIRMPAVCFGTATILLIFVVGRHLFGTVGGLVAAAIYTFAPIPISTTNFGRYFSQLQFFTLLTVYFYHRTVAGTNRSRSPGASEFAGLDSRDLWLTTAAFIVTYLSWEGVAIIVPGMILACLFERRGQLQTVFCNRSVWLAMFVVLLVVVLQHSHRAMHQASTLWYGTGARDIALTPMWLYPQFDLLYYVWAASWQHTALLPVLGLLGAGLLALEHPQGRSVWYLSLIFYINCCLFSLVLPVRAVRYAYHLVPLVVLLNSAFIVWSGEWLYRLAAERAVPHAWKRYAQGLTAAVTIVVVIVASGLVIRSEELTSFHVAGPVPGELRVADQQAATRYLLEHIREGDVVLAVSPHVVEHEWRVAAALESADKGAVNYWIESRMQLQPALDDVGTETVHRLSGTNMISTVDELENVFARHRRIWYLTSPSFHGKLNTPRVSSFLEQHTDVVYEDYQSILLFRDANHRPASIRLRDEDALGEARTRILP